MNVIVLFPELSGDWFLSINPDLYVISAVEIYVPEYEKKNIFEKNGLWSKIPYIFIRNHNLWGDVAQEVELSSGSRRVAGSIPPWACRSVPEQDT